jgi:hypothetical protein
MLASLTFILFSLDGGLIVTASFCMEGFFFFLLMHLEISPTTGTFHISVHKVAQP